uniref:Uncharacterized protein n=1 Tax=Utricularia reniformis TaxID=192314 RepID=A0A1Y0B0U9_9LAMI|nr:hypothetical protein AEK19_MT0851 [Utricularia reniformis]YP_009382286.1 hypothetical protein AEK19_MT1858 [Utricularia reniformis]ART31082.1 hypothetical protein AEK19_MT0851 [Utricularia reniformis]ART32029.1 hypothetical protein AEK19_MT1858 [Utricularia reniformis]
MLFLDIGEKPSLVLPILLENQKRGRKSNKLLFLFTRLPICMRPFLCPYHFTLFIYSEKIICCKKR